MMTFNPDLSTVHEEIDAIDEYFECVTACSIGNEGIDCVTKCIQVHLKAEDES